MGDGGKPSFTFISAIVPAMKGINIQFIILEMSPAHRTKDGNEVRNAWVADASGSINISIWNEAGAHMQPGDICRIRNGFANAHKGSLSVSAGRKGDVYKIGEFNMTYSETPNMSAFRQELLDLGRRSPPPDGDDPSAGGPNSNQDPPPHSRGAAGGAPKDSTPGGGHNFGRNGGKSGGMGNSHHHGHHRKHQHAHQSKHQTVKI